jgi:hypothetical protein
MIRKTWALALAVALGLGLVTAPAAPAQAVPSVLGIDWSKAKPTPPAKRVIEVVDKVKPAAWRVSTAANWLDKYTASDMRMVARCSGKAYRCITVRSGKVKGSPVGWSQGSTITIDTGKANGKKLKKYYRHDKHRTWLLVHELAHQFGLGHSSGRNVMNSHVNRYKLTLTKGQRNHLRNR